MSTSRVEGESWLHFDKQLYAERISRFCHPALEQFHRIIKSHAVFNMAFVGLIASEVLLLLLFFTFLSKSSILSICLATIFLTAFSYFILRLYFNAKKPEQFLQLRDHYIAACKKMLNYQEGVPELHLALANAASKFATTIQEKEYTYYRLPARFDMLSTTMEKFSCWWHWEDIYKMRETLLLFSIEEHLKLVQCEPTNLEVHAALANAYITLSGLYSDPRKAEDRDEDRWIPPQKYSPRMQQKFRSTAERAIEEFKILNDYAPNDPWVHAQLAYSYHDLQMPEQEIGEYETILVLRPEDKETLFKLGMLYFQQGLNAKGLQVYEELKKSHFKKAEDLIKFYGSYETRND